MIVVRISSILIWDVQPRRSVEKAGSALLSDPSLVVKILKAVVKASKSPVTLKMRTGPSLVDKNGVTIAKIAESEGVSAIAIHGRTRNCRYNVPAEYETIAAIKDSISIPVLVNGDIRCGRSAFKALSETRADGLMIGRAAQETHGFSLQFELP